MREICHKTSELSSERKHHIKEIATALVHQNAVT